MRDKPLTPIEFGLSAAIVAMAGLINGQSIADEPLILTAAGQDGLTGLPFGPFDALRHRTFEIGLRAWVEQQTGLRRGYVEQLYTFGERGRHAEAGDTGAHMVSIGYLALTRAIGGELAATSASFAPWYRFLPWEDRREGQHPIIADDFFFV